MIKRLITVLLAPSPSESEAPGSYQHNNLHIPPGSPLIRHELQINLKHYKNATPEFYSQIREAVAQGNVDAVVLYEMPEEPVDEVWKALSGAQPWHLEMEAGAWAERCFYDGLRLVNPPWPLKSLYLGSYHGDGYWNGERTLGVSDFKGHLDWRQTSFPECYAGIETLVLSCPNWFSCYFYPEGGASSLRSLTIGKNEALRTLACTVACNPALLKTLENLTIIRPNSQEGDESDVEYIRRFLKKSAIKNLELVLGLDSRVQARDGTEEEAKGEYAVAQMTDPYLGLYSCLPQTLQFFSLRAPATKFTHLDLDEWISNASNQEWLPNLQKVAFALEAAQGHNQGGKGEVEPNLERKVEELLQILRTRGVEIVETREESSMFRPLPLSR
ncbi:hypothetical protein BKA70DRAFT_1246117 [Coprinopsis sp. MPI-PUGE-AT-0042]|nr:hypothetical protein BKA70DRAFT_1246117 [Coprinopsis sp. MPI-PUGE-AT-0042]